MQRKDFLKGFVGLAMSVPALTSMAAVIPKPETLPEVRDRVFTLKHVMSDNRTILFPKVSHEQMREAMYMTRRSGFFMYNSSNLHDNNYSSTWQVDSDGLLAKGDVLQLVIKNTHQAAAPSIYDIVGAESFTGPDGKTYQLILVRHRYGDPRPCPPKSGDTFVLVS